MLYRNLVWSVKCSANRAKSTFLVPIARALANSNIKLTHVDFPWISFIQLL